jgi:hypothetical protein
MVASVNALQSIRWEYWLARRSMSRVRAFIEAVRQARKPASF